MALLGVGLVITRGSLAGLGQFGVGGLMMIGAVLGWGIYTHGASRFGGWSPLRFTTLTALAGTAAMLAASIVADAVGWQHAPAAADLVAVTPQLAYAVIVGAVIAVLAWNTGVQRLGAANAALFMNLVPVTTFAVQIARGYRPSRSSWSVPPSPSPRWSPRTWPTAPGPGPRRCPARARSRTRSR